MKIVKRLLAGLVVAAALVLLGFILWAETPLGPGRLAVAALESDPNVTVTVGGFTTFEPTGPQPTTGFIFYPGGRVDYRSYAVPLHAIAAQGYLVVLLPVRLNLAFFDVNAAAPAIAAHPEIRHWAVGGHSLGGVASALFAERQPGVEGLIFWASYPADASLRKGPIKMLSIYGTRDMAGPDKFKETALRLSPHAQVVVIEGGNHGQFGDYGPQPGDQQAAISRADQQAQIVEATVKFLRELGE